MFLEPYRLEENPFSKDRLRPLFRSQSYDYAADKLELLLSGQLQHLFLSGPTGIGKTLLLDKELNPRDDLSICRLGPGEDNTTRVLQKMLAGIGPGPVAGTQAELRNILHVYLMHQTAHGQRALIVADGVERDSIEVVKEIEALVQMRRGAEPIVQLVLSTRNEELVAQFRSRSQPVRKMMVHHQRLIGFTLDETEAYLRSALKGAGCEWFEELIPPDLILEIQSFTQGIVGDIDALCREALAILAERSSSSIRQQSLDLAMLKEAAAKLRLRYDAAAWKVQHEEVLLPSAIRQSRRDSLRIEAARLSVSSNGRTVAEVTLNRPRMILGRDSNCDISLDSSYVSRYQNLFMETSEGWMLIDLNSTNGCYVNGRKVNEHKLRDGDLISLGQHHIRFTGTANETSAADRDSQTLTRPTRALT